MEDSHDNPHSSHQLATASATVDSQRRARGRARRMLAVGTLPKGCAWIKSLVSQFSRALHAEVIKRKGRVDLYDAAAIQSALRFEQHALLVQRWLRLNADTMSHADRLAYSREIARASSERDKCLRSLGLDVDEKQAMLDAFYTPLPSDATAGQPGDQDGAPQGGH
jgi:hypothetical protein